MIAHPEFQYVMDGQNFIEDSKEDASLTALADIMRKMIKGESDTENTYLTVIKNFILCTNIRN